MEPSIIVTYWKDRSTFVFGAPKNVSHEELEAAGFTPLHKHSDLERQYALVFTDSLEKPLERGGPEEARAKIMDFLGERGYTTEWPDYPEPRFVFVEKD